MSSLLYILQVVQLLSLQRTGTRVKPARRIGLAAVAEWEAEHGAFTPEELAAARAEMAAADHEYFHGSAVAA